MHFPCYFRFPPYFRKMFRLCGKFSENFLDFHPTKFLMTFFSHRPQISNFPLFSLFQYISSLFRENYYFPPTFKNVPPVFEILTCFLHTFCVFRFPPTLTMMHLCITQCTYWTPLSTCVRGSARPPLVTLSTNSAYICISYELIRS